MLRIWYNRYFRLMRRKLNRMIKRSSLAKIFIFCFICYFCYLMGVFTHFLEKDFHSEFQYPSYLNIRLAVKNNIPQNDNTFKYIDINNYNYKYIYDSNSTCNSTNKANEPYLVVLVKSKLTHFEQRSAIRETWGHLNKSNSLIRIVFLLGVPSPEEYPKLKERLNEDGTIFTGYEDNDDDYEHHQIDKNLKEAKNPMKRSELTDASVDNDNVLNLNYKLKIENDLYGDIVQLTFYDTYYNNTLKAIAGLRWIDNYCSHAQYYLFIDDDYYLNTNLLIDYLKSHVDTNQTAFNNLYAGYVFPNSSPMRHIFSKWYISLQEYPYDKFPPYVSAGCYILSKESVKLFYLGTKFITSFRFDDIYLGILAYKLNIQPLNIDEIYFYPPTFNLDNYLKHIIASHGFSPALLRDVWKKLENFNVIKTFNLKT